MFFSGYKSKSRVAGSCGSSSFSSFNFIFRCFIVVYRSAIDFCILRLYHTTLLNLFTTSNNKVTNEYDAANMFLTRKHMLESTHGAQVLVDDYNDTDDWGLFKVKLRNGLIVELAYSRVDLSE